MKKQTQKVDLQLRTKFKTEFTLTPEEESELYNILHSPKIEKAAYDALPEKERHRLAGLFTKGLNCLAFQDYERLVSRLEYIMGANNRKSIWENNHLLIINAIDSLTREQNRFPSRQLIEEFT